MHLRGPLVRDRSAALTPIPSDGDVVERAGDPRALHAVGVPLETGGRKADVCAGVTPSTGERGDEAAR